MTQDSLFHSGQQRGDARAYTAENFHNVMLFTHLGQGGYVITSGTLDVLGVTFSAGQTVSVAAGSAFVAGVYYNNSAALNVVLENNATTYTRIDRIVIRVDWTAQTARIVAKRGTASSSPSAPELTQEAGNIYEIPLAMVFCPPSFAGFGDEYIIDERPFSLTTDSSYYQGTKNLMPNSEFIPSSYFSSSLYYGIPGWTTSGAGGFAAYSSGSGLSNRFDLQSRGRAPRLSLDSGRAIGTFIWLNNSTSARVTLSFAIQVESGTVLFSLDGGATTLKRIPVTNGPVVITVRTTVGSAGGNQYIEPYFSASGNAYAKVGQITLTFGNVAAPFMPKHETVPHQVAEYFVINASASDKYNYNMEQAWPGVRNFFVKVSNRDTLSSGADSVYASLLQSAVTGGGTNEYLRVEVGRHPNSIDRYQHGLMCPELEYSNNPITSAANHRFWRQLVTMVENGASTLYMSVSGTQT